MDRISKIVERIAGQRVNPKYIVVFDGELPIRRVIEELEVLLKRMREWRDNGVGRVTGKGQKLISNLEIPAVWSLFEVKGGVLIDNLIYELRDTSAEIQGWKSSGANKVKVDGGEWIPLY